MHLQCSTYVVTEHLQHSYNTSMRKGNHLTPFIVQGEIKSIIHSEAHEDLKPQKDLDSDFPNPRLAA